MITKEKVSAVVKEVMLEIGKELSFEQSSQQEAAFNQNVSKYSELKSCTESLVTVEKTYKPWEHRTVKDTSSNSNNIAPSISGNPLDVRVKSWLGGNRFQTNLGTPSKVWVPKGNYQFYLSKTPARLAVGKTGLRYLTKTSLNFSLSHARAKDAVHIDLDDNMIKNLNFIKLCSAAEDKSIFLRRPDLGRKLNTESIEIVNKKFIKNPRVQLVIGDGLSAMAINTNLELVIKPLLESFAKNNISVGTGCCIKNARVSVGDEVGKLTGAEVVCMIVGERPGLNSAESMGAYIAYVKGKTPTDAQKSMISNIHSQGIKPEKAADMIMDLLNEVLTKRAAGVDLL